jgi:tRNA (guanine37-N1)-methyltransferase
VRIDIVSIFPDYLSPLSLSLAGKAQRGGLLDLRVHDLRDWTHDRHHSVDDAPYGGGAGMVMSPEPWGRAIDAVLASDVSTRATVVVPTPAGDVFDQRTAEILATREWLVFACGRYEGIDQRVVDHYRSSGRADVVELSIGDYVLNGGEVAALAVTEAVVRLLPGFVGNPESLVEESHTGSGESLLEAPVYTRPPVWRGHEVPAVLLGGDHGQAAAWRRDASLRRTAERRPDLAPALLPDDLTSAGGPWFGADGRLAMAGGRPADAGELWTLQRCCWVAEAQQNESFAIAPLTESLADVHRSILAWRTWVVRLDGRLVAAVRARSADDEPTVWQIGRLMVAPDLEGHGLGRSLLTIAERAAPEGTRVVRLFTGARSIRNLRIYRRAGYRRVATEPAADHSIDIVRLEKSVEQQA